jgi:hypothetical protein
MTNQEIISTIFGTIWLARKSATVWSSSTLTGPIANVFGGIVNNDEPLSPGRYRRYEHCYFLWNKGDNRLN